MLMLLGFLQPDARIQGPGWDRSILYVAIYSSLIVSQQLQIQRKPSVAPRAFFVFFPSFSSSGFPLFPNISAEEKSRNIKV